MFEWLRRLVAVRVAIGSKALWTDVAEVERLRRSSDASRDKQRFRDDVLAAGESRRGLG